ncbi:hypothetical protein ACFOY4_31555 [Actinomadura syzygii]|uniref:Uncharacterized protein n=1 Tax=Actinomadura syzygii TaxID=1427538 RepID=A0A5D0UCN9_9ACTN|nr:hypothetical protein [Actinomadura syzygii]TYC15333.1 hypothetical protein FXF65_14805 [Actinomadura syzygii]
MSTAVHWAVSLLVAAVLVGPACLMLGSFWEARRPGGSIDLQDELLREQRRNHHLVRRQRDLAALILAKPAASVVMGDGTSGSPSVDCQELRAAAEEIERDGLLKAYDAEIEAYLRHRSD